MAKDPAFLFYSKDFYEGTRTMLPDERACYIDLLIYQHQNGGFIPTDIRRLLMYCSGVSEATLQATLQAKFKLCDKGYFNETMSRVMSERSEHAEKQSINGTIGQFFKKAKATLNPLKYAELRNFLKEKYTNQQLYDLIIKYESDEARLQALLKLSLSIAPEDGNAIADEDEDGKEKGVVGEKEKHQFKDSWFNEIFDELLVESIQTTFPKHNLAEEFKIFKLKVRGSPDDYMHRDTGGIRQAFIYQLKHSKPHANGNGTKKSDRRSDAILKPPTDWGEF